MKSQLNAINNVNDNIEFFAKMKKEAKRQSGN